MTLHVYAGPTITAQTVHELAPAAQVHPPVQHGDLLAADAGPQDTVLIVDGLWHQAPPVRHKEILELLHRGTTVAGAASMGALRAAELAPYGMTGIGWVYEQYVTGRIDADDEVAVIQTPDGRPLSTALVCLRYALNTAARKGVITREERDQLVEVARGLRYRRRSWQSLGHAAARAHLMDAYRRAHAWAVDNPESKDIKAADAAQSVTMAAAGHLPAARPGGWRDLPWRTSHLRRWAATYRPAVDLGDASVPLLPALQHAQLYDARFPGRWRHHVLAWIAGTTTDEPAAQVEEKALRAAADRGLRLGSLAPEQIRYWVTPAEMLTAPERELMLRVLVRSARLDPTASVWPETPGEAESLLDVRASARAAVVAWHTNREVAATGPHRTTAHLDPARVRAHLAEQWGLNGPVDEAEFTAAARDRGILSGDQAVQQARPFYLSARDQAPARSSTAETPSSGHTA